jgi:hypothetical protein
MSCGGIKFQIIHTKEMTNNMNSLIVLAFQATVGLPQETRQRLKGEAKPEGAWSISLKYASADV